MKDRVPTQVLQNGAIRQEMFDANGNSLGYQWIKRADDPAEDGSPLNKATFLKDETAARYGLDPATAVPDDVLGVIAGAYLKQIGHANLGSGSPSFLVEIDGILTDYAEIIIACVGLTGNNLNIYSDTSNNYHYGTSSVSSTPKNVFFNMRKVCTNGQNMVACHGGDNSAPVYRLNPLLDVGTLYFYTTTLLYGDIYLFGRKL